MRMTFFSISNELVPFSRGRRKSQFDRCRRLLVVTMSINQRCHQVNDTAHRFNTNIKSRRDIQYSQY